MPTKGEIDKEKMFRKIIPSAKAVPSGPAAPSVASPTAPESRLNQVLSQQAEAMAPPPASAAPQQAPTAPQQAPQAAPQQAAVPPQREVPQPAAPPPPPVQEAPQDITKEYDGPPPYPVNLAELLLDKQYERFRQKVDGCSCEQCRDDVYAITLNKIQPQYVASNHLDEAMQDIRELTTELVTALMNALFIVKRNPRHG